MKFFREQDNEFRQKEFYKDKDISDGYIFEEESGFPLIKYHSLDKFDWLISCQTTRKGGVSEGYFSELNLGISNTDSFENIEKNYSLLADRLGVFPENIVITHQVHSTNVVYADEGMSIGGRIADLKEKGKIKQEQLVDVKNDFAEKYGSSDDVKTNNRLFLREISDNSDGIDGFYTDKAGLLLSTTFADCVPIYIVDPVERHIALVHSGWKGTVNHIANVAIEKLEVLGSKAENMIGVVGASICQTCYEVTDDVASEFKKEFADTNISDILQQTDEIHYQLDLWAANWYNLKRAGLQSENIHFCGICTMCNSDILFSHRATNGKRGNINAFLGIRE